MAPHVLRLARLYSSNLYAWNVHFDEFNGCSRLVWSPARNSCARVSRDVPNVPTISANNSEVSLEKHTHTLNFHCWRIEKLICTTRTQENNRADPRKLIWTSPKLRKFRGFFRISLDLKRSRARSAKLETVCWTIIYRVTRCLEFWSTWHSSFAIILKRNCSNLLSLLFLTRAYEFGRFTELLRMSTSLSLSLEFSPIYQKNNYLESWQLICLKSIES